MDSVTSVSKTKEKSSDNKNIQNSIAVQKPIVRISDPTEIIRRIHNNPNTLTRNDAMLLQSTIGNKAVIKLLTDIKNRKESVKKENEDIKVQSPVSPSSEGIGQENHVKKDVEKDNNKNSEDQKQTLSQNADEIKTNKEIKAPVEKSPEEKSVDKNEVADEVNQSPKSEGKENINQKSEVEKQESSEINPANQEEPETIKNNDEKTVQEKPDKASEAKQPVEEAVQPKLENVALNDKTPDMAGPEPVKKVPEKKRSVKIQGEDPGKVLEQLESISPADVMNAFPEAVSVSAGALENQKQKTQNVIPEIPAPTGILPGESEAKAAKIVKTINHDAPEGFKSEQSGGEAYKGMPQAFNEGAGSDKEEDSEAIMREARACAAQAPTIGMTGEADPSQVSGFKAEAANNMQAAKQGELSQINNEFGENNICPKPDNTILKSDIALQEVAPPNVEFGQTAYVPDNIAGDFNKSELAPMLKSHLEGRKNEYQKGKTKFDGDVVAAKADTDTQIEQMKTDAREKQLNEQAGAKAEVNSLKGEWKNEVQDVVAEYDQNATSASEEKKREISGIKEEKEGEVQKTMAKAENDAQKENKSAKAEAEEKKKEGKKDDRNIFQKAWDWTKEKAQQFADGLKKAVNFIFDKLRKAVKVIFDKAKEVAVGLIEAGRKLIVSAIKGLGQALKGFVKVAFAKFPGIANKICSKIDGAVNKAVKVVNFIADGLKKGVTKTLGFLSKTLDGILGKAQSLYNSVISGIGKFLKGDFKKIFGAVLEGLQIAAEIAAAFATGGGSILVQIGIWLGTTLPGLFQKVSAVIGFVNDLRSMKLDDVKQFLTPGKIGDFLVKGLFGELKGLPQGEKEEKEKDKEPEGGRESKGLLKVFQVLSGIFKVLKGVYGKVAGGLNKILPIINISTKPWFDPFSMIYAGAVKALEVVKNPAEALNEGAEKLKESMGEFFNNIKTKVVEVAGGIKEKVMIIGKPAQLMKLLANKAVDMVLNFIITHPPSALIKAAFKVIEAVSGKSIVELVRQYIPFADKLINKIAESGPVQGLLKPLQQPVNYVGGMIDEVTEKAVNMVDESEQKAVGVVGNGEKLLKGLAGGAGGGKQQGNAKEGKKESGGGGGGDLLGSIKGGIHTRLLSLGSRLLQSGKALVKAGAGKAINAVRKMLTPKVKFKLGDESHELWVEQDKNQNVVMMASDEGKEAEKNSKFKRILNDDKELNTLYNQIENEKNVSKVKKDLDKVAAKAEKDSTGVSEVGKETEETYRPSLDKVPPLKNGEFYRWFNSLTTKEFNQVWADSQLREKVEYYLRRPGKMHEWLMVSRAPVFKSWGIKAEQIHELRSNISDVKYVDPYGAHGKEGSTTAHNEILKIIDSSSDFIFFKKSLQKWAERRLENGIQGLPEGLRQ